MQAGNEGYSLGLRPYHHPSQTKHSRTNGSEPSSNDLQKETGDAAIRTNIQDENVTVAAELNTSSTHGDKIFGIEIPANNSVAPIIGFSSRNISSGSANTSDYGQIANGSSIESSDSATRNEASHSVDSHSSSRTNQQSLLDALSFSRFLPGYKDKLMGMDEPVDKAGADDTSPSEKAIKAKTDGTKASKRRSSQAEKAPIIHSAGITNVNASFATYMLDNKSPSDPLTLQDLESFLVTNRFVRERDLQDWAARTLNNASASGPSAFRESRSLIPASIGSSGDKAFSSSSSASGSSVAFPQPSVLGYADLQRGIIFASTLSGLLLGASIMPNLWLIGSILGALYGADLASKITTFSTPDTEPTSLVPRLLLRMGRWIAKTWLRVYDSVTVLWFLYKTGQLSYEYFKRYEALDQRFAIQDKIDAWNARFVQGKVMFDEWERQNEVGRKVMATLRTAWLVEEQSLKKLRKRKSKYRIVQLAYDGLDAAKRLFLSLWLAVTGRGGEEVVEFIQGIQLRLTSFRGDEWTSRLGACMAALFALNMTGALFTLSPTLLSVFAVLMGLVWPSWWPELVDRLSTFVDETRARGRRESNGSLTRSVSSRSSDVSLLPSRWDKSQYGYYIRPDGTRRYYLKGQPWFRRTDDLGRKKKSASRWPWQKKDDRNEQDAHWGWLNPWQ